MRGFFILVACAHQRKSFSCEPGQTVNFRRLCRATGSRLKGNSYAIWQKIKVRIEGVYSQ